MWFLIKNNKSYKSKISGKFAGAKNQKIFGRLTCHSGKRKLLSKNRVFFLTYNDAIESGYRPCKICKPEINDKYVRNQYGWHLCRKV